MRRSRRRRRVYPILRDSVSHLVEPETRSRVARVQKRKKKGGGRSMEDWARTLYGQTGSNYREGDLYIWHI